MDRSATPTMVRFSLKEMEVRGSWWASKGRVWGVGCRV